MSDAVHTPALEKSWSEKKAPGSKLEMWCSSEGGGVSRWEGAQGGVRGGRGSVEDFIGRATGQKL